VHEYDAVVVGSGAAGGWAAKELCEAGLDVLLVEAGRDVDPAADYPLPAPPPRRLASRVAAAVRGQPVQARCAAFDARTRRFFVDDRENPYSTPPGSPFNWFRGRQVGGRLHVWGRVALRLSDAELADWPLAAGELTPYYDEVERFMGVEDARLTGVEERFRAALASDARVLPVRLARHDAGPVPATIRAARATGRLTLSPDSVVRRVTVAGPGGRASGVELVDRRSGELHESRARSVVLCASTIETLRILLNSRLGDSSGRLGRFVMDHVIAGAGGPQPGPVELPETAGPYDRGPVTGFAIAREGYGVQGGIGRDPRSWYMLAHGRMSARAENRVSLDPRAVDAFGVPLAHIACAHGPAEAALAAEQLGALRELAAAAGLRVRVPPSGRPLERAAVRLARRRLLAPSGAFLPGSAAHEIGGAGMGRDPRDSVSDPWGRLWEAGNVVVADGAVFPTGCWQNVTLTIMALALRAARRLARDLTP
jgi:choline dehydrogenase-like flavoprotein